MRSIDDRNRIVWAMFGAFMGLVVGVLAMSVDPPGEPTQHEVEQAFHDQDAETCRERGGVPIRSYTAADGSYRLSDCKFPPAGTVKDGAR